MKPMGMAFNDAEFDVAEMAAWSDMARRILKGASPDSLDRIDEDGLVTKLFYPVKEGSDDVSGHVIPAFPYQRLANGWQVCQPLSADATNEDVHEALSSGATALSVLEAAPDALAIFFDGVVLPAVGIGFDGGAATAVHYRSLLTLAGDDAGSLEIDLGLDPMTQLDEGLALHGEANPAHRLFRIDGWSQHNAGLTAAQELGFTLAGMAALFRGAEAAGIAPGDIATRVSARLALPADLFAGTAKCRAMRLLWDGLLAACGVAHVALRLEGYVSLRMMSALDDEVNMLRTTTAFLGGAIGGADAMAGFGHDVLTGESAAARRTARLSQVMMMAESGLSANLDPAAGAPFIESRTDALAEAGWQAFQEIEAAGGLAAATKSGMIAAQAEEAAMVRDQRLRAGEDEILGATLQPTSGTPAKIRDEYERVRRPAALVEQLRRQAAAAPPRILILRGASDNAAGEEREIRRWLGMAGLQAVTVAAGSDSSVTDARPDIVIGCGVAALPGGVSAKAFRSAAEILSASDRMADLEALVATASATQEEMT